MTWSYFMHKAIETIQIGVPLAALVTAALGTWRGIYRLSHRAENPTLRTRR